MTTVTTLDIADRAIAAYVGTLTAAGVTPPQARSDKYAGTVTLVRTGERETHNAAFRLTDPTARMVAVQAIALWGVRLHVVGERAPGRPCNRGGCAGRRSRPRCTLPGEHLPTRFRLYPRRHRGIFTDGPATSHLTRSGPIVARSTAAKESWQSTEVYDPHVGAMTRMISVISAVIAVLGAVFTAGIGFWWQSRLKNVERLDYMSRYRDSLLWVAFDLQSRIYNILFGHQVDRDTASSGFMQALLLQGTERQAKYARFSTAYVFAEYLGWAEVFRRDIQFLDLGKNRRNRRVLLCLSDISRTLSSARIPGTAYRLFRADQRAIGELMIADDSSPGNRWCRGYAEFTHKVHDDQEFQEWTQELFQHIERAAQHPDEATERLLRLQHQLVELVDLLDPDRVRFPVTERTRFQPAEPLTELEPYQVGKLGPVRQDPLE